MPAIAPPLRGLDDDWFVVVAESVLPVAVGVPWPEFEIEPTCAELDDDPLLDPVVVVELDVVVVTAVVHVDEGLVTSVAAI